MLLVLGGMVITVQGFETVRYLRTEYDGAGPGSGPAACRSWCRPRSTSASSRVATPVMGFGIGYGPDNTLLDITGRVVPLLACPWCSSPCSASSARRPPTRSPPTATCGLCSPLCAAASPYLLTGAAAILLVWLAPTFTIIVVASRAFAAYYALQCVVALRTSSGIRRKLGFGILAIVLALIALLAQPAG